MLTKHNRATLIETETLAEATVPRRVADKQSLFSLLNEQRGRLFRFALLGLVISTIIAFVIPPKYEAVARLMPPDQASSNMGSSLISLISSKAGDGLGSIAGDMLNMKGNSGALVTGVLSSD